MAISSGPPTRGSSGPPPSRGSYYSLPGTDERIAAQIARDAALAMALQSEEMEPLPPQRLDNASYLALLQRNAPRQDLGARDYGEHAAGPPQSEPLAEEWAFARRAPEDESDDAPLDDDHTERVLKGGPTSGRAARGRCGTGMHRRRSWRSLPTE